MMSGVPLETCWAFNKLWNNKFYYKVASCWLFLLIHTTMHGAMNIKYPAKFFLEFGNISDKFVERIKTHFSQYFFFQNRDIC
jgi:hypothetical protein